MSACSYHVIARYDDCTLLHKTKGIEDIRRRHRKNLSDTRLRVKTLKTIQNRKSLVQCLNDLDQEESFRYFSEQPAFQDNIDEIDYPHSPDSQSDWGLAWGTSSRSNTSSPSLSCHSDGSSASESTAVNEFHELVIQDMTVSRLPKNRRDLLKSRKKAFNAPVSADRARANLNTLMMYVRQIQDHCVISSLVRASWSVISNAISTPDWQLSHAGLQFFEQIITERVVDAETALYILKQGVIFSLGEAMMKDHAFYVVVVRIFTSIIQSDIRSIPYLIELMSNTHLLKYMDEAPNWATKTELDVSLHLYETVFEVLMNQMLTGSYPNPIVPNYDLKTLQSLDEFYKPASTLKHLVNSTLLESLITKYINLNVQMSEPDLIRGLRLLLQCIRYIQIQVDFETYDVGYLVEVLQPLYHYDFDRRIRSLLASKSNIYPEAIQYLGHSLHLYQNLVPKLNRSVLTMIVEKAGYS